jgi:hypothetical protein
MRGAGAASVLRHGPLIVDLHAYMREQAVKLSRGHDLAKAFNYILKRWASSLRMGACAVSLPPQAALFGDRFAKKHVALRLALRSVDAGRISGRG